MAESAEVGPWQGFPEAAAAAVQMLHTRVGLALWLVTRVEGADQVVVAADPPGLLPVGAAAPWQEGYCWRMVRGEGPKVAPVLAAVPAYAGLRQGQQPRVRAYLGVPLRRPDGTLYGTVCGFGTRAQPATLAQHLPMVELVTGLLATILALDTPDQGTPAAPGVEGLGGSA